MKRILLFIVMIVFSMNVCADEIQSRFPEIVSESVVAIMRKDVNGQLHPWGTGFLLKSYETPNYILVTNRHVFFEKDSNGVKQPLNKVIVNANIKTELPQKLKHLSGKPSSFDLLLSSGNTTYWTGHPNKDVDIAVIYFPPPDEVHVFLEKISLMKGIGKLLFGSFDSLVLTQDVLFFGFPLGIGTYGSPKPVIRYGMISYFEKNYKSFYIDGQVFGGSSGSPVVTIGTAKGDAPLIRNRKLIGIISGYEGATIRYAKSKGETSLAKKDSTAVENSGLAMVFSADLILETIELHKDRMAEKYKKALESKKGYEE